MRQGEGGDGVHVVNPGALLVPPNLNVILRDQDFGHAVAERGESGHTCEFLLVVVLGCDSPDADFVVLVCGKELVGVDHYGFHGTCSRGYEVGVL